MRTRAAGTNQDGNKGRSRSNLERGKFKIEERENQFLDSFAIMTPHC